MNALQSQLIQVLDHIKEGYGLAFNQAELDYLMRYFVKLNRAPTQMEIITYVYCKRRKPAILDLIQGHKTDFFYPHAKVMDQKESDSLALLKTPSEIVEIRTALQDEIFYEDETRRARNLRAANIPLPREVISVLEDQYLIENHYVKCGYHHYQREEGVSQYLISSDLSNLFPVLSSKAGFSVLSGPGLEPIFNFATDEIQRNNTSGFPTLCTYLRKSTIYSHVTGCMGNVLSNTDFIIRPGDLLILLGQMTKDANELIQNECQLAIFGAYALGEKCPIAFALSLKHKSLAHAVLEILRRSSPGLGVEIQLQSIQEWVLKRPEDTWIEPLPGCYFLVVPYHQRHVFKPIVEREQCIYQEIGKVTELGNILLYIDDTDILFMDLPTDFLFNEEENLKTFKLFNPTHLNFVPATVEETLQILPYVDKSFFINQMDRTSTGFVVRDAFVGPWQVPVADLGVTVTDFKDYKGEAIALGMCAEGKSNLEVTVKALGQAITNITAASIEALSKIHLILPRGYPDEFYEKVREMCEDFQVNLHPLLPSHGIVMAFAPVIDVRKTLTPQLVLEDETDLIWISFSKKSNQLLKAFFNAIQQLNAGDLILAYHAVSESGLLMCALEMAFASKCGLSLSLPQALLFEPRLGAIIQIRRTNRQEVLDFLEREGLKKSTHLIGLPLLDGNIVLSENEKIYFQNSRASLHKLWAKTGYEVQRKFIGDVLANQAYDRLLDELDPGLHETLTFDPGKNINLPLISELKPSIAILRFPGSQGHVEIAAAFDRVGFECVDVHLTDILKGRDDLQGYVGLAVGGSGWDRQAYSFAQRILEHPDAKICFTRFFERSSTFTLGVGSGFHWLLGLKAIIPGTEHWAFSLLPNQSNVFESRWTLVKIEPSSSAFLKEMEGSFIPLPIVSGQGRLEFLTLDILKNAQDSKIISMCYTNHYEQVTENYPFNPTGSRLGVCAISNLDGRVLGMVGHPERACRTVHQSWHYRYVQRDAPWLRLFRNARALVG